MKRTLLAASTLVSAARGADIDTGGFAQDGSTTYCQAASDEQRPLEFHSLTTASGGRCAVSLELTTHVRSYSMAETALDVVWMAAVARNATLFAGVLVAGVPNDVASATLRACRAGSNCASDSDMVSPASGGQNTALGAFDSMGAKKLASVTFTLPSSSEFVLVGKITLLGESKPTDFVVFKHVSRSADADAQPGTVQPGGGGSSSTDSSSRPLPAPTTASPSSTPSTTTSPSSSPTTTASSSATPTPHGGSSSSSSSPSPPTKSPVSSQPTSSPPTSTSTPGSSPRPTVDTKPSNSGSSAAERPATREPTRAPSSNGSKKPRTTPSPVKTDSPGTGSSSGESGSSSSSPIRTPTPSSSQTLLPSTTAPPIKPQSGQDSVSSVSSSNSSHSDSTALISIAAVMAVVVATVFVIAARVRRAASGNDDESDDEEPTFRSSDGGAVPNLRELREQEMQTRVLRIVSSENPSPPSTFAAGSVAPSNLSYGSDKSEDLSFSLQ